SVDRMEKGDGGVSAMKQIHVEFGFPIVSIVTIEEIVTFLHNRTIDGRIVIDDERKRGIDEYRTQYGA
ncbi:MAG: hypothetical protein JW795_14640, partial [Chitinivibrionales bacterium]|nr:hypothetical protein [Chitinivibrionales bacterium]